jgi:hypothetical protein
VKFPRALIVMCLACWAAAALAQQTVYNVPNGDVLDPGKVYVEADITYHPDGASGGFTPRIVIGVGHRIEAGLNMNGLVAPGPVQTTPTPTIKWKAYDGGDNGWAFLLGDDLFIPVQNRAYNAGNYVYAEFTKTWKASKTRATFGAYDCTRHVVARGNRAGGQFAIEQPVNDKLTLAADWYTGHHALGFVTPGVIVKLTPKLTWYGTYQFGNSAVRSGNHQFLMEIGWNLN